MKKINKNKLIIFITAVITISLLVVYFKDIIVKMIQYQADENFTGIRELLYEKGWFGALMVVLVEALQMVVVFISAEFIQVSAGLTYPWYISILLCDIGVCLGATLIFLLVRTFKFDSSIFKKTNEKITKLSKHGRNVQMIMYFLFFMPIIPFGAICYYGSNTKISYRRYLLTCATGVIPSIISSIFIGRIISIALIRGIPFWVVILAILLVILLLIVLGLVFLHHTYFKKHAKTPDSVYYALILKLYKLVLGKKVQITIDNNGLENVEGPYILLTNHPSFFDSYCTTKLVEPAHPTFILNRYYFRNKLFRYILEQSGTIPKKLFSPDLDTIKKTIKSVKNGYSIYMCPEGRLGVDGTSYYITKETGKFVKQLKLPVVIASINGAYFVKPKWRKHKIKGNVHVKITKILSKEEVLSLNVDEINDIINQGISYNDFEFAKENNYKYLDNRKAEGLENILYHCPKCHQDFKTVTNKNQIMCTECGFSLNIEDDYHFNDNELGIKTIHDWYLKMSEAEKEHIKQGINMSCKVEVKKFNMTSKKLDEMGVGTCYLTNDSFIYEGNLKVQRFEIPINHLKALAFSCNEEFECYYDNELYYFYPTENRQQCAKWALIVDEIAKESDENEE